MKTRANTTEEKHFFFPFNTPGLTKTMWWYRCCLELNMPSIWDTQKTVLTYMIHKPHKLSRLRTPWITWTNWLTTSPRIKFNNSLTISAFVFLPAPFDYFFDLQVTPAMIHDFKRLKQFNWQQGDTLAEDTLGLNPSSAYCQEHTYLVFCNFKETPKLDQLLKTISVIWLCKR